MKRKSTILRVFALLALMLPWTLQAQNAKVSEYDGSATTATYSSIASTNTARALSGGYVDVQMPFAMYFGTTQVPQGSTLRVWNSGSVTFDGIAALADARIAPLYLAAGYTATQVYTSGSTQMLTVEWRKVVSGNNSYSFQLKLYPNGDIEFCYGPMTISGSINVLVGMMSSGTDIYRVGGANNGSAWDTIYRNTTGATTTRTLSSTYAPAFDVATSVGMVYSFTQPACVKPTSLTATTLAWNSVKLDWVASQGNSFEIKYSTDADFNPDEEGTSKNVSDGTATTYTITGSGIVGSTTYYFYIRKVCSGTPSGWSPMASATTLPGCYSANLPSVTPAGVVTWTSPNALVTSYDVKYGPAGFTGDGTIVSGINGLTTTLTGLQSASSYDVYLRTHCSASGLETEWVGPVNFRTPCDATTVTGTTPYLQEFSVSELPMCWNQEIVSGSYNCSFDGNYAIFTYMPNASTRLITPVFNLDPTGAYQVEFDHAEVDDGGVCDSLWLYYRTSATGEWVRLGKYGSHADENNPAFTHTIELLPSPSTSYQLAFVSYGMNGSGIGLDNVLLRTQPNCPVPSALEATAEGVVTWTASANNTSYDLVYGPAGFSSIDDGTLVENLTATTYTIPNLTSFNSYDVYIRAHCSATNEISEGWVGPVNFVYFTGDIYTMGTDVDVSTCNAIIYDEGGPDGDYLANTSNQTLIIRPGATNNYVHLEGDYYTEGSSWDYAIIYDGVGTSGTALGEMRGSGTLDVTSTDVSGALTIWFKSDGSVQKWGWELRASCVPMPTCFAPTALNATPSANSAELSWTENNSATQWEVRYWVLGNEDNASIVTTTSNTSFTLNYLDLATTYEWQVRSICSSEDVSDWSEVGSFATEVCMAFTANPDIEIGTSGTTNSYLPTYTYYNYSLTEQIYTSAEVGGASTISSVSFYNTGAARTRTLDVYLIESDKETFSGNNDWVPVTAANLVYSGSHTFTSGDWSTITFTSPFSYSGEHNLVLVIDDNTGSYQSAVSFRATSATNKAIRIYSDPTNYNPASPSSYSGTRLSVRNDVKFGNGTCDQGSCVPPTVAITTGPDGDNARADLTFSGDETTFGYICGPQGFTPNISNGVTVNGTTATITPLVPETTYDLYVYSVCSGVDNPRMVRYSFTTPFVPTCKPQVNFAVNNVTYNSATVTWQQEDPNQVPESWTVRYATTNFDPATADASAYTEETVLGIDGGSLAITGLNAGDHVYLYTKATCNAAQNDFSVDWSSYIFSTPACVAPTAVTATEVTNSTAVISWTENGAATAWTMKYAPQDADLATEGVEVDVEGTPSFELTGLAQNARYNVYVKSNCTANDESAWSSIISFRTACPGYGELDDEVELTIGEGTSTNTYLPLYNFYNYSLTEQIYTIDEIGGPGLIHSISIYNDGAEKTRNVDIYLLETDKENFSSTTDWVPVTADQRIYSGSYTFTVGEWSTFTLSTPFEYTGAGNLLIVVDDNTGSYSSSPHAAFRVSNAINKSLYVYSDGTNYNPLSPASYSGTRPTVRNNVKFGIQHAECDVTTTCFAPVNLNAAVSTASATFNNVTISWTSRTDLRPIVDTFELVYGPEGFNPNSASAIPLNNVFNYIITEELPVNAPYDVYLRTVCGEGDYSNWVKTSFTTAPSCWAPVNLAVSGTTTSSATLSWVNDANSPIVADRWDVAYGFEGFNPDTVLVNIVKNTTNNTALTINNLRHSTKYEFYVRAVCSTTNPSAWSAKATGTTGCGIMTDDYLPIVESFDGTAFPPTCWTTNHTAGTGTSLWLRGTTTHSGSGSANLPDQQTGNKTNLVSPQIHVATANDYEVSFWIYRTNSYSTKTQEGVKVWVNSTPDTVGGTALMHIRRSYSQGEITETATGWYQYSATIPTAGDLYVVFEGISEFGNGTFIDDVVIKKIELTDTLPNANATLSVCNEYLIPTLDTNDNYSNSINATYVIRPAEAGKVAHITGTYDLENGYDYLNVYRGAVNANNLVGRYTGNGVIDYKTGSNLWADSGYVTLVFTTDADNALPYSGFKLLVECENPTPGPDITETFEENGTFTWRNGVTYTNNVVRTGQTYDPANHPVPDADNAITAVHTYRNVAGVDSVTYHMALTLHPTYNLTYNATICERDTFAFYGNNYTATNTYTVPMTSQYGADSTGVLVLQVNPAPSAAIYKGGDEVTEITNYCDKADLTLLARSNADNATFVWEDNSTAASRLVNPHESDTFTVVATNPTTGCTSLPASVTVTTTPVPSLTISGDAEICSGQSATLTLADANNVPATYRWNTGATTTSVTVTPTATTTYSVTATTSNESACTATADFTVVVNPLPVVTATASVGETCRDSVVTLTATEVEGYSYSWNTGATTAVATTAAASTGAYTVTVTDQNGCVNEFNTATVTVYPSYEMSDSLKVCFTYNPYTWGAQTLTANGDYDQNFTIGHGCDSLVHLTFTFEEMGVENSNIERCYGDSYTFENITRTANADTALYYIDNSGECPVRYNLAVTVNPVKATAIEQTVCDTYTWPVSGETYTATGAYPYTLATTKGCDSVVTMNLTVNYKNTGVETVTACDNYVWDLNGVNYTATTNEPTFTLQNQWGCDSIVTLDLTVNYRSYHEDFHCVSDARTYTWLNGRTYNLNVNLEDSIQFVTGTNEAQCNEIALLHLIMNPVLDSLAWANVEACDEYVIDNAVVVNQGSCMGEVEPQYLRESGDYEIRTRAADGHDQMTRIHLTVTPSTYHTTIATACLPYTWTILDADSNDFEVATITAEMVNGAAVYNTSVDLSEAGFTTSTCSSIEVLRLTPKYPDTLTITDVVCQNGTWYAPAPYTYSVNGSEMNVGLNTKIYNLGSNDTTDAGCPLTKQVELTVNPVYSDTVDLIYCEGDFNNDSIVIVNVNNDTQSVALTIPGALNDSVYTNTVIANWTTALGCDSIVTINYTVNPTLHQTVVVADACHKYTWDVTGTLFDSVGVFTEEARLTDTATGCDIMKTLQLTVLGTSEGTETHDVCTSYIGPDGVTYYNTHTFDVVYDGNLEIVNGCDSITHVTYNVRQNTLFENNVVANQPYTWINGTTYTASVSNVYHQLPADSTGCYDVVVLNLTMVDPIVLCDNELPYTATYGETSFTIDSGAVSGVWDNNDADGNDTIIAYTINNVTTKALSVTACDSYTWTTGDSATYTASGEYTYTTTNAAGCDSVVTMTLTVNTSTAATIAVTNCDTYTWAAAIGGNDSVYNVSGTHVNTIANKAGCDSVITLNLTINKNDGVEITVNNGCDSYTWDRTGIAYTVSGDYTKTFTDINGCEGDSVLHLTINPSYETNSELVINDAGSYTYLGVMYTAPVDTIIDHTFQSVNGCDSLDHLRIVIPVLNDNNIVEVNIEACGTFTWEAPDGTGHTYGWIPMSERQSHGMALYKDLTDNRYVYTYPTDTTFVGGVMTQVRVLHLNLLEATTSDTTMNVPVSLGTYTIAGVDYNGNPDNVTITFNADSIGTPIVRTVGVGSVAYCNDYRTFTINVFDNYDTTEVYACADATTYEWNSVNYTIGEPSHTYFFTQKENEGTLNELVHVLKLNQRAVNAETMTETACDSYTWAAGDSLTYTNSVTGVVYNYTDANGCAATKTLNLTIKHNTSLAYSADVCDTYTWTRNNQTYTATGDYTYSYTDSNNCAAVDTLHLTIRNNTNMTLDTAVCVSYTWSAAEGGDGRVLDSTAVYTYEYNATNGCPSVNTLNLTINMPANAGTTLEACDSAEWNGTKYYTSGTYFYSYNTTAGCASVDTLYLTVNNAEYSSETLTQCDKYVWNGTTYTTSGIYTHESTNAAGCQKVDTLHLTINVNTTTVHDTLVACDTLTWSINNRLYTNSGNYTATTTDSVTGCPTTNTLNLTINHTSSYDSVLFVSDGSYRYYGQNATELFGEGVYNRTEHYTNVAGCDSTLNITFNIGTALLGIDNVVFCNEYTWRNGETYVWISDEERAANLNDENDAPLYKTSTGTYIYYNPTYTVVRENAYDSIYMLALTLTQSAIGTDDTTINISDRQVTYGDSTFHFDVNADSLQFFTARDVEFDVHFAAVQHCDSIITLTVHLVNNYQEADVADICVTTSSYTWRNHTISTATNDYDHAHTYYVYDTLASGVIEYATVNQHPLVYATERRTACDSYTWNGTTYTESTSNATAYFPEGTVINPGTPEEYTLVCDSTVTLILTINKNSSTKFTASACESYKWVPTKAADSANYTVSGTYFSPVYYTAKGCASVDTLELTVNYKTSIAYVVDTCDSYTWNNTTYTASDTFYYSYADAMNICTSTDTLYLTIRNNSNKTYTKVVCDAYTWADTLGGNGEVYTASGTYTYNYNAVNGCPSTNTLKLTVNKNKGHKDVLVACDSAQWHGTWYYANNSAATFDYADTNNCPSVDTLNLTINTATHNVYTEVACNTYTWDNNGNSNTYTVSGTYKSEYNNASGCPSVDTLKLTIGNGHAYHRDTVVYCGPYTWTVNDQTIGTYSESVQTSTTVVNPATGCDSTIFLYLTINPQNVTEVSICNNGEYVWTVNNTTYTEAGTYDVSETDNNGNCISNERLVLTVNPVKETALTDQICLGKDYIANGFNIAADSLPTAGVYTFVANLTSYQNCDSVVTLTLTVGDVINNPVEATSCDSYAWNAGDGQTYNLTASGTYNSEAYTNAQGCTTVDVLTLTINVNAGTVYNQTICDAYMWNGTQYTESGDYTYAYTDGNGCASVDTLHLTVNNSVINNIVVTACDSYTWENGNGEIYTVSGAYTYNYTTTDGCTGIDNLVLTINTNTNTEYTETACDSYVWNDTEYTESGDYEFEYDAANGCPSKDVLHLTVNKSTTSEETAENCSFYNWHGETYTTSGDYTYVSTNNDGCQNTATLHLTINNPVAVTIDTTVCGYFNWNGIRYNETDVITHNFTAANGCDSIETINLTVNSTAVSVATATACDSYTWDVNGSTYTQSGNYVAILEDAAVNGCDSMITLVVTINNSIHNTESVTACDSYTWNGTPYTTSGTYTYAYNATNGCPSVDTLNLTVNNSTTGSENVTACNYYLWNGNAYTQSGTYTSTLTGANGCDSVATLNLTIGTVAQSTVTATSCNAYTWNGNTYTQSGAYTHTFTGTAGCDSVVTLLLTISQAMSTTLAVTACDSYTWNGVTYANSGNYSNTYSSTNGCDSIVTLALTINNSTASTVNATACDSYTWRNGQTYTASTNTPTTTIVNAAGCDSVITLHLTINNSTTNTINATACDSYTWNNTNYTTSGNYTQTYPAANGCDSTVTLNLTIQNATNATVSVTACDSYTWINGQTYTTSTNTPTVTLVNAHGCDSIVTLNLTINNGATGVDNQTACESYTWIDGQTYTVSTNTPTYTLTAANGCDSVVTLNLTVNYGTTGVDNQTACGSYTWIDGETYTASTNTPTYTLPAANGCDSVVTLNLTINNSYDIIDQVSACDGFIWIDNVNYTESTNTPTVTLQAMNGCDSVVTLHLTINHSVETYDTVVVNSTDLPYYYGDYTFNETGDYALGFTTVNGCDSTVYLHFEVNVVGINTVSVLDDLVVYPNPTRGGVTLTADKVVKVEVLDIVGRCVATFEGTNTFDISNLAQGSYTLRITLPEGVTVRKVVKK